MAEAILERTRTKVEKSIGKARAIQARRKAWEDVNKIATRGKGEAMIEQKVENNDDGDEMGYSWEMDEEMDSDDAGVAASAAQEIGF